jgi:hypothetical protein
MKVYRIPLKRVFAKKKIDKDATWNNVYGKVKCAICKQHFKEGEAYTHADNACRKYAHVECVEKHGAVSNTGSKSKKLPGLRKKTGRLPDRQDKPLGKSIRAKKQDKRPVRRPV